MNGAPQPGDIGVIEQPYQHHFLVFQVSGSRVLTIDGNSLDSESHTGTIVQTSHPIAGTIFFRATGI